MNLVYLDRVKNNFPKLIHQADEMMKIVFLNSEDQEFDYDPIQHSFIIIINNQVVSHVGFGIKSIKAGGKSIIVGGLGGVATLKQYRGLGYASELILKCLQLMESFPLIEYSTVLCASDKLSFYKKNGYAELPKPSIITSRNKTIKDFEHFSCYHNVNSSKLLNTSVDYCGQSW